MSSDGPVAIVTGAGGGIGRAVCRHLADAGYRLTLVGRTLETLDETAAATGRGAVVVRADLGDPSSATTVINRTVTSYGRVDVIVNNAAIAPLSPIEEAAAPEMEMVFRTNVIGPFLLVKEAWSAFRQQAGGTVINISSKATEDPFPGLGVYAASKCALESLTRTIMNEGGDWGMNAWSIAPGAVETEMLRSIVTTDDLPSSMALTPDDIANLVMACLRGDRKDDLAGIIRIEASAD